MDTAVTAGGERMDVELGSPPQGFGGAVLTDSLNQAARVVARSATDPERPIRMHERPEEGRVRVVDRFRAGPDPQLPIRIDGDVLRVSFQKFRLCRNAPEDRRRRLSHEHDGEKEEKRDRTGLAGDHPVSAGSTVTVIRREPETTWPVGSSHSPSTASPSGVTSPPRSPSRTARTDEGSAAQA